MVNFIKSAADMIRLSTHITLVGRTSSGENDGDKNIGDNAMSFNVSNDSNGKYFN